MRSSFATATACWTMTASVVIYMVTMARAVITLQGLELDRRGMLVDFADIKRKVQHWIDENLDHNMLLCQDDPLLADPARTWRACVRDGLQSDGGEHRPADL